MVAITTAVLLTLTAPVAGTDITVIRLGLGLNPADDDCQYFGAADGIRAFSWSTTGCNISPEAAEWVAGTGGRHPIMTQNVYRLLDGRFEQIGMGWTLHEYCATNASNCGTCQPTSCGTLGVGCDTSNVSGLMDGADGGARVHIDPQGSPEAGTHLDPFDDPQGSALIRGRVQVHDIDILQGGRFFIESHVVTHDEDPIDRNNNTGWREVDLKLTSMTGIQPGLESVHSGEPALMAWAAADPGVTVVPVDVPDQGRFFVAYRVTDNGDGTWHYQYVLYNMNVQRAARSFAVPLPADVTLEEVGFHDVDYHSGDGVNDVTRSGTDWSVDVGDTVGWTTSTFSANPNANALGWATAYNFRFDADRPPGTRTVQATIGLFRSGDPGVVTVPVAAPAAAGPVPTLSMTGVLAMTGLLLVVGSVVLRRRRQATAQ